MDNQEEKEEVQTEINEADADLQMAEDDKAILKDEHITRIQHGEKEIILIGTAHISKQSAELVKKVIELEHPDSVCIELDDKRFENIQNPKAWESMDIIQVIKAKKTGFMLANLALSSYQKKMAKQLDTPVGGEMLQGIESAKEVGAELVLADRDIQTTFLRIWRKLGFWRKSKLLTSLLFSSDEDEDEQITEESLQELMQKDMLESVLSDIRKDFPEIGDVLIQERDQHLAAKIKEAPGKKVVAVLGGAHIPGVTEEIGKTQDLSEITIVPKKSTISRVIGWAVPMIIIALLAFFFKNGREEGIQQLQVWIASTVILTGVFALLARAHPLSILIACIVSPVTPFIGHPLVASGVLAGIVETMLRKPTVSDIQSVSEDIFSLKGFFRNRVLRILMVVTLINMGTSLGTVVASARLILNLFN